ncbi:hypothetical protein ACFZ8E_13115 [Methylobacterium sp. HMF5984]|uniref:hypothetical protein n=1 Tax=Methylobacterium sp. HMF5984 TaxID=3367370 RepID=UPI0038553A98
MSDDHKDIQLKFDGGPIKQAGGAPADLVISSLTALQRLVHLIGMKSENRVFGQRIKPSARVRRDFSIVCRSPKAGSHIQAFDVVSGMGEITNAAINARHHLLNTLKAFDSGDENAVKGAIPDDRERWFFADAAYGLLPPADSEIQLTVRAGTHGPFSFSADRARLVIEKLRSGKPPRAGSVVIPGKLKAIDFTTSQITLQPSTGRAFRVWYPPAAEQMVQSNARRRFSIHGIPDVNSTGDIVGFERVDKITEIDSPFEEIAQFEVDAYRVVTNRPIKIQASYDFEDKLFIFQDAKLGIDAWSETYSELRDSVVDELKMLWIDYAMEADDALASDAKMVKRALNERFKAI